MKSTAARLCFTFALCLLAAGDSTSRSPESPPASVFVILIDTLRADHLGCYGYSRPTSPEIDRLAAEGILFAKYFSVCNWTRPSVATIFTGLYPEAVVPNRRGSNPWTRDLSEKIDTLAERLKRAGVRPFAALQHASMRNGFEQGYESYSVMRDAIKPDLRAEAAKKHPSRPSAAFSKMVTVADFKKRVSKDLDTLGSDRFFYYLHLIQPHAPYAPPEKYLAALADHPLKARGRAASLIRRYDGEILHADEVVGVVRAQLEKRKLLSNTWLIVTADHGEAFLEHGRWQHGNTFYNEVIQVPLVARPPDGIKIPPMVIKEHASSIDLMPTILELTGTPSDPDLPGRSLMRFLGPNPAAAVTTIFSGSSLELDIKADTVIGPRYKLYTSSILFGEANEVFDLESDFSEKKPIQSGAAKKQARLMEELVKHREENKRLAELYVGEKSRLTKEDREELRSLGY